jgi:tRNA uridine 5-carboxymethylaminomethyl modification enzyme
LAGVDAETAIIEATIDSLGTTWLGDSARHADALEQEGLLRTTRSLTALDVARRPDATLPAVIRALVRLDMWSGPDPVDIPIGRADTAIRYGAFVDKEQKEADRHKANESRIIPDDFDYALVPGLRVEASQQLAASRPSSLGHASRTAGVTPSDIGALLVHLTRSAAAARG